jgi:GntR family transcriptional regulator
VLERLRFVDEHLTLYDLNYLPLEFAESVISLRDEPAGSLYETLKREHRIEVAGGRRIVDAALAGAELAKLLDVAPDEPLIVVEAVDWAPDRRPFDCYRTWLRPDRMKIEVSVTAQAHGRRS